MPATLVPTTTPSGLVPATWPATDGQAGDTSNENYFVNGPNVGLLIANTGGAPGTVTFRTPYTEGQGLDVEDPEETIAAGARQLFGPFDPDVFGDNVQFLPSAATLKFIVIRIPAEA